MNNPEDESAGTRKVPFSKVLWIERADFREDPPRKFFRLAPGREVRLRYAYFITCTDVVKNESGEVVELRCTYDPETRGGSAPDGRKVRGTIHWVSAEHALEAEVRLYDHLFTEADPNDAPDGQDFRANLNPPTRSRFSPTVGSSRAWPEQIPARAISSSGRATSASIPDSSEDRLVLNRTVTLRDTWAKIEKKVSGGG